ncbi:unnamed protein product [Soboliphyme baturini]|uniref:Gamma-interferon inducible lysosomal thiol reductase n=1 Tax=Soboliphyme baturini TaxID=241478 RepID=A0A183IWN9_9BILA|nr:unnamed protein product [Soboliphyme baturini]
MASARIGLRGRKGIFGVLLVAVLLLLLYYRLQLVDSGSASSKAKVLEGGETVKLVAKVIVEVYFSSLCPDSTLFFAEQLVPFWRTRFHNFVQLVLVPYGKASFATDRQGKTTFLCQHGPDECYLNKAMTCAIELLQPDVTDTLKIISCLQGSEPKNVLKCTANTKLTTAQMQKCIDGQTGDDMLKRMGKKTDSVGKKLLYIPTIYINGRANKNAEFHLHAELCKVLPVRERKLCLEHKV